MSRIGLTLKYSKPYTARGVLYVLFVVLSVVFTMATALSVADFLKILFGEGDGATIATSNLVAQWLDRLYRWLIDFGRFNALLLFSAIIFVLYSLKNIFSYLAAAEIGIIRTRIVRDLRNDLFHKALRLPVSYYDRHRKGDVLARFGSDMVEYDENTLGSVQMLLTAVVSMVLYMAMLFYLNVKLTAFVLCMLPLVAFVVSGLSRRLKRKSQTVQEMNSHLVSLTDETIGGLKVIKAYTAIDFSNRRFQAYNRDYTRRRTSMFRRIYAASPISDFLGNVIVVGILLFGSLLIMHGDHGLTADLFISYVMLFVLMIPPAKDLSTALAQMKKGRACEERVSAFLAEIEELDRTGLASRTSQADQSGLAVELRHVSFCYTDGVPVLQDVSLGVPRGSTVALVGASGSGKSTIADLIGRYYDIQSGELLFGGEPVGDIPLATLRSRIGVVAQDTLLFNDSVAHNIAFGRPDATRAEIEAAAHAAQAHDFISALPQGYDTNLGEGGSLLSGGQRQRISIARALLRNPELLILDEATSALDTESERQLQTTLDTVLRDRTAIVIAHRLSTVVNADLIVVLDQGRIVEQGTHNELMALGGRYSHLVALQTIG
ncbi:MAG: ABC transporter ATP-binding protein/permease [Bacteroidales bacterium]|nr:ABC transporter ATP-binding protein/permease [Bacteroidales bacterium]